MSAYEVVAADWREPNVIATYYDRAEAERYADRMDGLALRCYVREIDDDIAEGRSLAELNAIEAEHRA